MLWPRIGTGFWSCYKATLPTKLNTVNKGIPLGGDCIACHPPSFFEPGRCDGQQDLQEQNLLHQVQICPNPFGLWPNQRWTPSMWPWSCQRATACGLVGRWFEVGAKDRKASFLSSCSFGHFWALLSTFNDGRWKQTLCFFRNCLRGSRSNKGMTRDEQRRPVEAGSNLHAPPQNQAILEVLGSAFQTPLQGIVLV